MMQRWPFILVLSLVLMISTMGMLNFGHRTPILEDGQSMELLIGPDYSKRVLPLLKKAQKRLWVGVYVASYYPERPFSIQNQFLKALVEAYKNGVDVKVVLDESYEWDVEKHGYSKERSTKNDAVFNYLKDNGVPVLMDSFEQIMHGKFIVIDDQWVVLGSTNWTYSALSKNVEVSTLIQNEAINSKMEDLFSELWNQSEKGQKIHFR